MHDQQRSLPAAMAATCSHVSAAVLVVGLAVAAGKLSSFWAASQQHPLAPNNCPLLQGPA